MVDKVLYQCGIINFVEGVENDINVSKIDQQLVDVMGMMKEIEVWLMVLINSQSQLLNFKFVSLLMVSVQLLDIFGYELLVCCLDLQVVYWYIEVFLSEMDVVKVVFYLDINLMVFLQQDVLYLSDFFCYLVQQMGVIVGLMLLIFDSGCFNVNLDIVSVQNSLLIVQYNKVVVDVVNQVVKIVSQVEILMVKSQQQQQVEKDVQWVVDLVQV